MATNPTDLAKLLGALRTARDPWSRLRLVAGGARQLARLTQRERRELLRRVGLEGAEELADLAAGGDAAAAEAVEQALRSLEGNPEGLQRFVQAVANPQTRRQALSGLAAHVLEVITAPSGKAEAGAAGPGAAGPGSGSAPAGAGGGKTAAAGKPVAASRPSEPPATVGGEGVSEGQGAAAAAAAVSAAAPSSPSRQPGRETSASRRRSPDPTAPTAAPVATTSAAQPAEVAGRAEGSRAVPAAGAEVTPPKAPAAGETVAAAGARMASAQPSAPSVPAAAASPADTDEAAVSPLAALQTLREQLARGQAPRPDAVAALLERDLPGDWARRRALAALFASGYPPTAEEGLALVNELGTAADRRWALLDLAASRRWSDADRERLLAAADSPAVRRRLALRSASR